MSSTGRGTVAIIGQGYVGLPLAMTAAESGWKVLGIDNSDSKVHQINSGVSPVEDVSDYQLKSVIENGSYVSSTDFTILSKAQIIIICVPTPLNKEREPDLSILKSAVSSIAPNISNDTLVLCESTSFPGTLRNIIVPIIESLLPKNSNAIYYASAPERVNPGDSNWNQRNTPRLVGGISDEAAIKAVSFYESICNSVIRVSKPEIAEAAKLLENTFRLVNIALVNEFNQICSVNELDINEVIKAASSKPYGFMPFKPGIGVGGHCIPVDPIYLKWWAQQSGVKTALIETADFVNHVMPRFVADKILSIVGESIKNPRILILGVAYKSGVADIRETPVKELYDYLTTKGAKVSWNDPFVKVWGNSYPVDINWPCDIAVLTTNQPGMEFGDLISRGVKLLDCTGTLHGVKGVISL